MFEIQNYSSFIAAIVVFQLIPGPGTLATSQPHTERGRYAMAGARQAHQQTLRYNIALFAPQRSRDVETPSTTKALTVPLFSNPSPAGGERSFVSRGRDFHGCDFTEVS
ncbi:MAG: hypothetical protein V5B30_15395 [Candidatus Accumulibacter delftensis]